MTIAPLLSTVLWILAPAPQTVPSNAPPSNTFITAAESVIDNAAAVDVHAADETYDAQLQQLKTAQDNLNRMASTDRDRDITTAVSDLVFAISTCHIQLKNAAPDSVSPNPCESRITAARTSAMQSINQHKENGSWVAGPPA
jgi:hypothetical protein